MLKRFFLAVMITVLLVGCGNPQYDITPINPASAANAVVFDVQWPQFNGNGAPPAYLNISEIEIILLSYKDISAKNIDVATFTPEHENILELAKKSDYSFVYNFDIYPGSENENGANIDAIPTGKYYFSLAAKSNDENIIFYGEPIEVFADKVTTVHIDDTAWHFEFEAQTAPLIVEDTSGSSITVNWGNDIRVNRYDIYLNDEKIGEYTNTISSLNPPIISYTFDELDNNTEYSIKIVSYILDEVIEEESASVQTNLIKDKVLEQYIITSINSIQNVFIADGNSLTPEILGAEWFVTLNGETLNDLQALVKNAVNLKITTLEGLEYCKNLENIFLSGNSIFDLTPLKNLNKVCVLDISGNNIIDLSPLSDLTNITSLNLDNNYVKDLLPIKNLINLKELNISNNALSDIGVLSELINIEILSMENNAISDISCLMNLINLHSLNISNNKISDISYLAYCINLQSLHISNNNITDISCLENLSNLVELSLDNNLIDPSEPDPDVDTSETVVDINLPPEFKYVEFEMGENCINMVYELSDDSENLYVDLYYSVDGGNVYNRINNIAGETSNLQTDHQYYLIWDYSEILENEQNVIIKLIPYDDVTAGSIFISAEYNVINTLKMLPEIVVFEAAGNSGLIQFNYSISQIYSKTYDVYFYYSIDNGINYIRSFSVSGDTQVSISGDGEILWDSYVDLPGNNSLVFIRFELQHEDEKVVKEILITDLYNNTSPSIENLVINGNQGDITVNFDLLDYDNSLCNIDFYYSIDGGNSFILTENVLGDYVIVEPGIGKQIIWQSAVDVKTDAEIYVKLIPNDDFDQGNAIISDKFYLYNYVNRAPEVYDIRVEGSSGDIGIIYNLFDVEHDLCDIDVYYSVDAGRSFTRATGITGEYSEIYPGLNKSLIWDSSTDILEMNNVIVKIKAFDGELYSEELMSSTFVIDNSVSADVNIIGVTKSVYADRVDFEVVLDNILNDLELNFMFSVDGVSYAMSENIYMQKKSTTVYVLSWYYIQDFMLVNPPGIGQKITLSDTGTDNESMIIRIIPENIVADDIVDNLYSQSSKWIIFKKLWKNYVNNI